MDAVRMKNEDDARYLVKCPLQLKISSTISLNHGEDVCDFLTKISYRVCGDGFYITSPVAPLPSENPTFTFDDNFSSANKMISQNLRNHSTRYACRRSEMNTLLKERVQKQYLLPSCQYTPRSITLQFTPNIAESIMTEESTLSYHHSIPDINYKSVNESILDEALDNIDTREDERDETEMYTWKSKEERDSLKPEDNQNWNEFDKYTFMPSLNTDILTRTNENHSSVGYSPTPLSLCRGISEDATMQSSIVKCKGNGKSGNEQKTRLSGLNVLKESGISYDIQNNIPQFVEIEKMNRKEKTFICDICEKEFRLKSSMRTHKRTHTGERPFKCDICKRSFSDRSTWSKHCRVHTGDKPFKCNICGKLFAQSGNVYRHQRNMHKNIL